MCVCNYKYIHIHVYDVHICISYHTSYNYIYAVVPWIVEKTQYSVNKQCSSTLCNSTLERVVDYFFERVLLTTCRHVFSGNFLAKKLRKEALQDNGCNTVCVKIRATPLCFIGYWVCTFCPEKPTGKYCTGTGWGIIVELPKYWSVIDSLKHN